MHRLSTVALLFISFFATAQQYRPAPSHKIHHKIERLKHLTRVLYLAAHPDDENTRLLAWLVNDQHLPTAYLSLTRGDGGQNILGSEQGAALGLIRTHELLEARKLDGAEQFFTRAIDFGFSKNPDETFNHWNEYSILYDIVWNIRKYRPDVIITRFPPDSRGGHGQHSASAILAAKAFDLAGDKLQYTEHLKELDAWQPKRLLWNTYRFGSRNTTSEDQFKLEVGQYSPVLGLGYGELAGISRSIHRSQGAGTPSVPGVQLEYFEHTKGDSLRNTLFDGIDITWNRVGRPEISPKIDAILAQYDFTRPWKSVPALLELRSMINEVTDTYWRNEKLKELDELILDAAGVMAEATTDRAEIVAGDSSRFTLRIIARNEATTRLEVVSWPGVIKSPNQPLASDSLYTFSQVVRIPEDQPLTQPYWMSFPSIGASFSIPGDSLIGLPVSPNQLNAHLTISINGTRFQLAIPLSFKKLEPTRGDVVEQLRVVPAVSVEPYSSLLITKPDGSLQTAIRLKAFADVGGGSLNVYANNQILQKIAVGDLRAFTDTTISANITPDQARKVKAGTYFLDAEFVSTSGTFNRSLQLIRYDHLPTIQYFTSPTAKVIANDWKVKAKKIGFVEGAGDYTVSLLRQAGLEVEVLKASDLTMAERLKEYDAIITGVRAVNVEPRMASWLPVLHQYVRNGGTLIMQYNTLQDLATTQMGPYPFKLANKRVTEEDAKMEVLIPNHPLLNFPNKIDSTDFQGWVQERGLYFPSEWDPQYESLFRMHDTGEESLDGAVLYTKYGKGHFIYNSLSFFRQLPAGQKGAIRLLMNMISAGKNGSD